MNRDNIDAKYFGENLGKFKKSLGLTSKELAQRSGLTEAAISQIINGQRDPSLKSIVSILKFIPASFEIMVSKQR